MTFHQGLHMGLQGIRRCIQVSVILLVLTVSFVSLYAHYHSARALDDLDGLPGVKGEVLRHLGDEVLKLESPQRFLDGMKGTLWSMKLFDLDLTDPLAAVEMAFASKKLFLPLFLSCLFWIVVTVLLGRVFCSWICPGYLLFEMTGKLRKLLRMAEVRPAEVRFSDKNKYVVLAVGLVIAGIFGLPLFALVYPPAVLSRIAHAWVFGTALTGMLLLMVGMVVFELFVSPRWWCRTLCPGGALYALMGWIRPVRVKLDAARCTHCGECRPVCEPGLDPVTESCGLECDNCGQCVRHCPEKALSFSLGLPGHGKERHRKVSQAVSGLLVLGLFSFGLLPAIAEAHHILGLPHYSYKENYPQVPTLEYPAQAGPYDILLTSYPGKPLPGETANIAIYVKNRQTGTPYEQPVELRVLQTFTFGKNLEVLPKIPCLPFDRIHKLSVTFPEDGEYIVELTLDVEGKTEVIPFMMVAGDPSSTGSFLIATCTGMAIFFVVIRAVRIKRARRKNETVVAADLAEARPPAKTG